jgi:hypothetical protein
MKLESDGGIPTKRVLRHCGYAVAKPRFIRMTLHDRIQPAGGGKN